MKQKKRHGKRRFFIISYLKVIVVGAFVVIVTELYVFAAVLFIGLSTKYPIM